MPEDPYAALSQFHSAIDNINNVNYAQEQNKQLLLSHNSHNEIDFHQQEIPSKPISYIEYNLGF